MDVCNGATLAQQREVIKTEIGFLPTDTTLTKDAVLLLYSPLHMGDAVTMDRVLLSVTSPGSLFTTVTICEMNDGEYTVVGAEQARGLTVPAQSELALKHIKALHLLSEFKESVIIQCVVVNLGAESGFIIEELKKLINENSIKQIVETKTLLRKANVVMNGVLENQKLRFYKGLTSVTMNGFDGDDDKVRQSVANEFCGDLMQTLQTAVMMFKERKPEFVHAIEDAMFGIDLTKK